MKDNINTEMNATFQKFQVKTCFTPNSFAYREFSVYLFPCYRSSLWSNFWTVFINFLGEKSLWPYLAVDIVLDGVDIRSSKEKILNLQELKLDTKVNNNSVRFIACHRVIFQLLFTDGEKIYKYKRVTEHVFILIQSQRNSFLVDDQFRLSFFAKYGNS